MKEIKKIFPDQEAFFKECDGYTLYRKEDVKRIFDKNKILIGESDAVPEYIALEIFGKDAVAFVKHLDKRGLCSNGYGIGVYTLMYLTLRGLELAATYVNIRTIGDVEGGAAV